MEKETEHIDLTLRQIAAQVVAVSECLFTPWQHSRVANELVNRICHDRWDKQFLFQIVHVLEKDWNALTAEDVCIHLSYLVWTEKGGAPCLDRAIQDGTVRRLMVRYLMTARETDPEMEVSP